MNKDWLIQVACNLRQLRNTLERMKKPLIWTESSSTITCELKDDGTLIITFQRAKQSVKYQIQESLDNVPAQEGEDKEIHLSYIGRLKYDENPEKKAEGG